MSIINDNTVYFEDLIKQISKIEKKSDRVLENDYDYEEVTEIAGVIQKLDRIESNLDRLLEKRKINYE